MPSKKKKYNARFPPARIKKIMQTDDEVGKVAAPVPVIISKALELFVESLITKASEITQSKNAKTLTTSHLKHCILAENKFDFLKDLVINVPDVQGEDDNSNSGIPSSTSSISNSYSGDQVQTVLVKPRQQRLKKQKLNADPTNSAGPSHQSFGESEEDGTTEEDEDEDEDDEENSASEQQKMKHFNNLSVPNNVIYPSSYAVNAVPLQVPVIHGPTALLNMNNNDDEDYDS